MIMRRDNYAFADTPIGTSMSTTDLHPPLSLNEWRGK